MKYGTLGPFLSTRGDAPNGLAGVRLRRERDAANVWPEKSHGIPDSEALSRQVPVKRCFLECGPAKITATILAAGRLTQVALCNWLRIY
jgi:hypothetical protein